MNCSFSSLGDVSSLADEGELEVSLGYSYCMLAVVREAQRSLFHAIQQAGLLDSVSQWPSGSVGSASRLQHLSARAATLTTSLHMLRRYQLLLVRDHIYLQTRIPWSAQPMLAVEWQRYQEQLTQHPPNVHDMFMWYAPPQPNDNYTAPWRPAE